MKEAYRIPRSIQDLIPVTKVFPDGVFLCGRIYTKSWIFTDINYSAANDEDKKIMLGEYMNFLKSLDSECMTKITLNNRKINMDEFEEKVLMPLQGDQNDVYRKEYNEMLLQCAMEANGIIQEKYITASVYAADIEEARDYFRTYGANLLANFGRLHSTCVEMTLSDRLRVLHDFYRCGEERFFYYDMQDNIKKGHSFKDMICPDVIEKYSDYLKLGDRYARVLYLKDYANNISDELVRHLTDQNQTMMLSLDILTIPADESVKDTERKLLGVETNAANFFRRQYKNNNYSATLPYQMKAQIEGTREMLADLTEHDQKMTNAVLTIILSADTKEELERITKKLISAALGKACQVAVLRYQQIDGMNTALPVGPPRIHTFRTITTEGLALFLPFRVREIQEDGGTYLGVNATSKNLILCNRTSLMNQSSLVTGVPGSGKSMEAKSLMIPIILNSNDSLMICDPEGEYAPLVEALGVDYTIAHLSAGGKDRLNAMFMVDGYSETSSVVQKSEFILSLVSRFDENGVRPQQKSIVDRCIREIYREAQETGTIPTLCTLREKLLVQSEPEAKDVALALELYTTGSLDIFGQQGNVDLSKRIIVFDIHELSEHLKPAALLVITDTMLNRVAMNSRKNVRTHLFLDEFHVMLSDPYSTQFFTSAWRQFRKRNAYPTAITQNVEFLTSQVTGRTMVSNSECVIMLNQGQDDREELAKLLGISNDEMSYITNAEPGCGLIRVGGSIVPFMNRFPKKTKLYQLMSTKPGEGAFSGVFKVLEETAVDD